MIREDWVDGKLEDLLNYIQPTNYIVDSTAYDDRYKTPVLTAGKTFILGYTDEEENIFTNLPVIIFDDFTTATKYVNFKFKVKSSAMKILIPTSESVIMKYVYYYMQTIRHNVDTHKRYWISIFSKLNIKIAPLPEQRAIVSKIEELFSELDSGIDSLNKAKKQLEVYRQAVLKSAFEGKLTKEWREDNSIKFSDWNYYKIGEIIETIDGDRGKNYPKKHEYMDDGYCLFLSTKNVLKGAFNFEDTTFISKEKDEILRGGKLERKDIVITTRGTLGNVAHYDDKIPYKNIRINSGMLILRIKDHNFLNAIFLMRFINSSLFIQQLRRKQSGTAQPQIPAGVLKEIEIMVPNRIDEQEEIIKEIESRLSVCDNIETTIEEALQKAEALRQSILKKAFEGKLLSKEEIEACKQEDDWEPADKLLKRIKEATKEAK